MEKIEYDEVLWQLEKRYRYKRRIDVVLRTYILFGMLTAVFGISYFFLTNLEIKLSNPQMISLLASGVGFTLAIASWGFLLLRKDRQTYELQRMEKMQVISDFLQFWNNFEIVSRDVLEREDKKFNKYSIREIIEILQKEGRLNRVDVLALDEAIRLRNSFVHRGDFISAERANKLMEVLNEVIQKVSSD